MIRTREVKATRDCDWTLGEYGSSQELCLGIRSDLVLPQVFVRSSPARWHLLMCRTMCLSENQ